MKKQNKKGFTLAELLIVVAIIAVLTAIAIPLFVGALDRAQDTRDKANIRAVRGAATVYLLEKSGDEKVWTSGAKTNGWDVTAEISSSGEIIAMSVKPLNSDTSITDTCTKSKDANNNGGFTVKLHLDNTDLENLPTKLS